MKCLTCSKELIKKPNVSLRKWNDGMVKYCNLVCRTNNKAWVENLRVKNIGKVRSVETKKKVSASLLGKTGKLARHWKGGITLHPDYNRKRARKWYRENPIKAKAIWQRRYARSGGKLSLHTVQMVYEDNIKRYGTLTCIYCLDPVPFGRDTIDHVVPLAKGGTNDYDNLAIACCRCNCSKKDKDLDTWLDRKEK